MTDLTPAAPHIHYVTNFQDLVSTPYFGEMNAVCWSRELRGDFSEIVEKTTPTGDITEIGRAELLALRLSEQGQLARDMLLQDWELLQAHGASPSLNVIRHYERDNALPYFPTDVYSYHADRSPIPVDTFLCTYFGAPSELLPNSQVEQKVLVPAIRDQLKKLYQGPEEGFESFLTEHFFDLHYAPKPGARPVSLGIGNLWRLAVDHPQSKVPPCIHRAPVENPGQPRLLMIC